MDVLIIGIISYLMGSIPFGLILTKVFLKKNLMYLKMFFFQNQKFFLQLLLLLQILNLKLILMTLKTLQEYFLQQKEKKL